MLAIRCESCGAVLDAIPGRVMAECPYCGMLQLMPAEIRQARCTAATIDFGGNPAGKNIERLLKRANLLWAAGNRVQARAMYREVLQTDPGNGIAKERLGM